MKIVVQKYGGSSVGSIDKIKKVADRIIQKRNEGYHVVVIVSAMGKTTDELIALAREISSEPAPREMDMLLTTGEQVSISLLSMALIAKGYSAVSYTGYQLNIQTTALHQKARIKDIDVSRVLEALKNDKIVVVAGFQGVTENNEYTTLGRGGSDTSAVALAAKLEGRCEIYTDVEGIYTMDPRKLKNARKLERISYEEMMEMASLGAGVMHYRAVELANKYRLPLYVASTFSQEKGTMIEYGGTEPMEETVITGMASSLDDIQVTVLHLPASTTCLYRLFGQMAEEEVNVDMISQMITEDGKMYVSFTIPKTELKVAEAVLNQWKEEEPDILWEINDNIAKISVVGLGMRTHSGVAAKVFEILAANKVEVKMVTTSEIKITFAIDSENETKAIDLIGNSFGLAVRV